MAMKHRRDPAKELFWRRMMDLWQDSGLTIRAFCQQQNLTNDSFYFWRAELARRDQEVLQSNSERSTSSACQNPSESHSQFSQSTSGKQTQAKMGKSSTVSGPLSVDSNSTMPSTGISGNECEQLAIPAFVPVTMSPTKAAAPVIEVAVASGRRVLRVPAGFDANLLRQLLHVLEEASC